MKGEIFNKTELVVNPYDGFQTAGCTSILFGIVRTGATDIVIQDSNDGTSFAAADAKDVLGTIGDDNGTYKVAYIGYKKYVKVHVVTPANAKAVAFKCDITHQG